MSDGILGPVISGLFAFVGVLVATALVPWIRGHISRKQAARYLGIRVVCILDKYVEDCAEVAADWGRENPEGYSESQVSAPRCPSYPVDLDWHSIDYTLMYDLLSLPTNAEKAAGFVSDAGEHADPPDFEGFFEARSSQYATLGLKAFDLTTKLRKAYRIPDLDRTEWDPVNRLKQELKDIEERRQTRLKAVSTLI
jgi:hypothetical protein